MHQSDFLWFLYFPYCMIFNLDILCSSMLNGFFGIAIVDCYKLLKQFLHSPLSQNLKLFSKPNGLICCSSCLLYSLHHQNFLPNHYQSNLKDFHSSSRSEARGQSCLCNTSKLVLLNPCELGFESAWIGIISLQQKLNLVWLEIDATNLLPKKIIY